MLPDLLAPGLKLLICGTAPGPRSALDGYGYYYAGPGNYFWDVLYRSGLTPRRLQPFEQHEVLDYGIGLTNLVRTHAGMDKDIPRAAFEVDRLRTQLVELRPRVLAFNGKRAAQEFYGHAVKYGRQPEPTGETMVFVLPSTSGAARAFWDMAYWQQCADTVRSL